MTVALLLVASVLGQAAPPARTFGVEGDKARLRYAIEHSFRIVDGESVAVEGKLLLRPDGKVQLMVRSPVASFKSGDANRDVHMQEVVEAAVHPFVIFKAAAQLDPESLQAAGKRDLVLKGELDFHGERRMETIPLQFELQSDGKVRVTGAFVVSLDAYKIERPSLLFMKLNDECKISFDLLLKEEGT